MALSLSKNFIRCFTSGSNSTRVVGSYLSRKRSNNIPLCITSKIIWNAKVCRFCSEDHRQLITIKFQKVDGTLVTRKGKMGQSVQEMIGTEDSEFPEYGACGGVLDCSTCHLILSEEDYAALIGQQEDSEGENDTLDKAIGVTSTSRLGCQIRIVREMEGIVVKLPENILNCQKDSLEK